MPFYKCEVGLWKSDMKTIMNQNITILCSNTVVISLSLPPGGPVGKIPPANAGDVGWILGSERYLEKEMKTYSCLGNPMDREAQCAIVHRVAKESDTY